MMRSSYLSWKLRADNEWSSDQLRQLRDLVESGASLESIAHRLRRTPSAVRNKAGKHGISLKGLGQQREELQVDGV